MTLLAAATYLAAFLGYALAAFGHTRSRRGTYTPDGTMAVYLALVRIGAIVGTLALGAAVAQSAAGAP